MSNYNLNILVNGGEISTNDSKLTADSVEYITAVFTFDESWDGLYKTAVFRVGEIVYHAVLENDKCIIPHEALLNGILYISTFGVLGTTRATTTEIPIMVEKSGYVVCEPTAPSPDPYSYFLEEATLLKEQTTAEADRSEAAANQILNTVQLVDTSMKNAVSAAEQAKQFYEQTEQLHNETNTASKQAVSAQEEIIKLTESAAASAESAKAESDKAASVVMEGIEVHNADSNSLSHPNIIRLAEEAKSIALGKSASLCFETEEQLNSWITGEYIRLDGKTVDDLKIGDNLYILQLGVPDYWWDGQAIQPLDAEHPQLEDYYTKAEIDSRISDASFAVMSRNEYDSAYLTGGLAAGCIYFVYEEE